MDGGLILVFMCWQTDMTYSQGKILARPTVVYAGMHGHGKNWNVSYFQIGRLQESIAAYLISHTHEFRGKLEQ